MQIGTKVEYTYRISEKNIKVNHHGIGKWKADAFFAFIRTGSTQSLDNTAIMNTSVPYILILSFLIAILAGWGMGCGL